MNGNRVFPIPSTIHVLLQFQQRTQGPTTRNYEFSNFRDEITRTTWKCIVPCGKVIITASSIDTFQLRTHNSMEKLTTSKRNWELANGNGTKEDSMGFDFGEISLSAPDYLDYSLLVMESFPPDKW